MQEEEGVQVIDAKKWRLVRFENGEQWKEEVCSNRDRHELHPFQLASSWTSPKRDRK